MARYIDEGYLMQKLSRMIDYCKKHPEVNGLTALFQVGDAIIDCPTADVAPKIEVAREIVAEIEDVINNIGYFDEIDLEVIKKKYMGDEQHD